MAMMDRGPWAPAPEVFNRFARMDRSVAETLNVLSQLQARDDKLAFAIEEGRVYGLRQQKYEMTLKKQLNRQWRNPPFEAQW